jgi:uncharacterized protein (TIGR00369 family)
MRQMFDRLIPFNRHLGLELVELSVGRAVLRIPFRKEYLGDVGKGSVHGGILSTLIDTAGGATASSVLDFGREGGVNTVDMRVDYVRPGRGKGFVATGTAIRKGKRIVVTRVEVHNDEGTLIAIGTATYSIFARDRRAEARWRQALLAEPDTDEGDDTEGGPIPVPPDPDES